MIGPPPGPYYNIYKWQAAQQKMYLEWLVSLKTESVKYQNTKLLNHKNK